ncbi:MAG: GAF domain-containing protein [Anaerolineae bacterium]|nr:GAF domain-containing protein [Anaerolineae bacterium]
MPSSTTLLATGLTIAYGLMLLTVLVRERQQQPNTGARRWLMLTLLVALAGTAVAMLPSDAHTEARYESFFVGDLTQPALVIIAANLVIACFGALILRYLGSRLALLWTVLGLGWWAAQAATSFTTADTGIGQARWLANIYDPLEMPNVLAFGGWLVIGVVLLLVALYAFYRARLSEIANQALFGVILVPLVVGGAALGGSGEALIKELGWAIQAIGLVGAVYGVTAYRVFDIRRTLRHATATAVLTVVTALAIFLALILAQQLDADTGGLYVILGALAFGVAVAYTPFRKLIETFMGGLVGTAQESSSQLLRKFSEDITGVVELDALVDVTMRTLREALRVRRGGLILVNRAKENGLSLFPVSRGMGEIPDIKGQMTQDGPIYEQLFTRRAALLQYDLDFGREYAEAAPDLRGFFKQMRMSAYAPVVVQGELIGILCCGAKASDDPFTEPDLELLITIANQAGVALRNARLVTDLRRREGEQADLNRELQAAKEQVEKLDDVKTDFITIASHELRTPLAQIRGYTDIMEAMNEQGMLDQDQIGGMTANLRKAADRLEGLITAMLDVSQLDVDAMDLRFAQTSVENVMRMAIEPLTEAIKNRKLMLSARGLRDLPPIEADMQRLVQAFRNVVLNAIKFTPDGGRIDISGRMQDEHVLVIIKDNGIGIDPANHELVFEKFFRAHDPSLHSTGDTKFMGAGPGLGLTIARGVVDAHGGRIWVESERHDPENFPGSTFYILLPLSKVDEEKRVLPFDSTVSLSARQVQAALEAESRTRSKSGNGGNGGAQEPQEAESAAQQTMVRPPEGLR